MELDKQRKNGIISIGSDTVYLGREKEDVNGNRMDGPLSAAGGRARSPLEYYTKIVDRKSVV